MANYTLIHNEEQLNEFIDFLPDLMTGEVYLISLLYRSKYDTNAKFSNEIALNMKIVNNKERILNTIKKMEVKLGLYTVNSNPVPEESVGVYIKPYPVLEYNAMSHLLKEVNSVRDKMSSSSLLIKKKYNELIDDLDSGLINHEEFVDAYRKIVSENKVNVKTSTNVFYSSFASTSGRKSIIDVDLDTKNGAIKKTPLEMLVLIRSVLKDEQIFGLIETRGGYHLQVRLSALDKKGRENWIGRLKNVLVKNDVILEFNSNNLLPIPGCLQGAFSPVMHHYNDGVVNYNTVTIHSEMNDELITGCYGSDFVSKYKTLFTKEEYERISLHATKMIKIK